MDYNEIQRKIVEKMSGDKEMIKSIADLVLDPGECEIAKVQKPNTYYVLTGKLKVDGDSENPVYHYHPVIKDCMINPDSVKNEMVYSESLIELQELIREKRREYAGYLGNTEFIILAVSAEVFEKLQTSLDRTIATVLENARHTTETFMKNSNLVPENSLIFQRFCYGALYQLMVMSDTVIGSALDEKSQILDDISKVKYEDQEIFGDEDEEEESVFDEPDYPVDDIEEDDDDGGCRCPFRYGCRD